MNNFELEQTNTCPSFTQKIGNTTYIVNVHFSETSKETLEDKIKRMIKNDIENEYYLS